MGRYGNYPTTVEDILTFRLKSLNENNNSYLTSYGTRKAVTSWYQNGSVCSKISIEVTHSEYESFIILDYKCNDEPIRYRVGLISKTSNLGVGKVWFFVCPNTGKLCKKLYLHNSYFLHRTAFENLMYQKQIQSKKNRGLFKIFDKVNLSDNVYCERYKKYFKTHYKGKPTKRYLKLQNQIDIAESYPPDILKYLM